MITGYFGDLGAGKTYGMTVRVRESLLAGIPTWTNYFFDWDAIRTRKRFFVRTSLPRRLHQYFCSEEDFMKLENGLCALDEGWIYFDSYKLTKFPLHIRMKLLQSRKDGLDLVFTSQTPQQVHTVLRRVVHEWYLCDYEKSPYTLNKLTFRRTRCIVTGDSYKPYYTLKFKNVEVEKGVFRWQYVEEPVKPIIATASNKIFKLYNTLEKIDKWEDDNVIPNLSTD